MSRIAELLPKNACGLRLYKIVKEQLIACEPVYFTTGFSGVEIVLRRAAISGRVEFEGEIKNHFADILIDHDNTWNATVALDRKSYAALKNHWMRCKLEPQS